MALACIKFPIYSIDLCSLTKQYMCQGLETERNHIWIYDYNLFLYKLLSGPLSAMSDQVGTKEIVR